MVENRGIEPRTSECKSDVFPLALVPLNLVPILPMVDHGINRTCRVLTVSRPTPTRITLRLAQTIGGQG